MQNLLVKVTVGDDAPEKCLQGLTVAATAAASGVPLSLWLAGEAVWLATGKKDVVLEGSPPASVLLAGILEEWGVSVCTQCLARRDIGPEDLLDGVAIGGAATFVAEAVTDNVQALVY